MRGLFAVLILAVFCMFSVPVLDAQERGGSMDYDDMPGMMMNDGMGMRGYCGMMGDMDNMPMMGMGQGMMGMRAVWMIDLTPDQRTKINKIQDDLRKQHWATMGKIMDEQAKLRDLYAADTLDAKKIGAVYDAISGLRKQMIEAGINAVNGINEVLTKEQREELKQLRRGRYGMRRGMMGH